MSKIKILHISSSDTFYIESFIGPKVRDHFLSLDYTKIKRVILDSSGGKVYDAMAIAEIIRRYGMHTIVLKNKRCYSACLLLLQAGNFRSAYTSSKFMIHYAYSTHDDGTTIITKMGSWNYFLKLIEFGMDPRLIDEVVKKEGNDINIDITGALKYNLINHLILE